MTSLADLAAAVGANLPSFQAYAVLIVGVAVASRIALGPVAALGVLATGFAVVTAAAFGNGPLLLTIATITALGIVRMDRIAA